VAKHAGVTPIRSTVRGAATVFSDIASVMGARLGSMVLSLVSVLLLTHLMSPVGYGTLAFFTIVATLLFTITSGWTSAAVTRYGREQLDRHGRLASVTWARAVVTLPLVVVGALLIVGLKLAGSLPAELTWILVALAVGQGLMQIVGEHAILLLEASGRMKLSALGMFCTQLGVVVAIAVVFVLGLGSSPALIASIWFIAMAVIAGVLTMLVARQGIRPVGLDRALLRRLLAFSAPLIAFTVSQYVIRSVDLVVIRGYETAAAVGIYAVAYQAYTVIQGVASAVPPVLVPLFVSLRSAQREAAGVRLYMERVIPQLLFLSSAGLGIIAPVLYLLVPIVFGAEYRDAARPMLILLPAAILFFGTNLLAPIILLHERTRPVAAVNLAAAGLNVVGDVVLIGPLGLGVDGAAVATLIALAALLGGYMRIARSCTGLTTRLPLGLLAPIACGVAPTLALSSALGAVIGVVSAAIAAAATQLWLSPFAAEDVEVIQSLDMPPRLMRVAVRAINAFSR
jgi:O-antigen/teichoic acid export membrane protein